jgi:hypothetical protein
MIESSRNASRPTRHTDHAPAANPREFDPAAVERRARTAMVRDSTSAWRKERK